MSAPGEGAPPRRLVTAVTGSRADFGLLRPVMAAIAAHGGLELEVIAGGSHLLGPWPTIADVRAAFAVAAEISMQRDGERGRAADAAALGRGVSGFAARFGARPPLFVLVLGDRIEAFAAAAAASVAGIRVAHLHGGDRAEGIADEAMRHAISKLAHVHLPATEASAQRLLRMGEAPQRVHVVGSPAIDELDGVPPLDEVSWSALGAPSIVVLLHPLGRGAAVERAIAARVLRACGAAGGTLALHPNHDPGREGVLEAIEASGVGSASHVPRTQFIGLLRRCSVIVGNSSAALIEAAALRRRAVNVGPRQRGRERAGNVIDVGEDDEQAIRAAVEAALAGDPPPADHPYGDGRTGERTAAVLASCDLDVHGVGKVNAY